jgi:ABC-type nitrate/sulfonate/bicarbonate transport system permease component
MSSSPLLTLTSEKGPRSASGRRGRLAARARSYSGPFLLVVGFLAIWELLARTVFAGRFLIPPPETVVWGIWQDRSIYQYSVPTTVHEAALGFLWGNLAAILVALLFLLVPITEKIGMRLAIVSYCLPVVAIAPILQIVLTGESPKIGLAAISVFFTTLIIVLTGLRSADPVSLELIKVYGGGSLKALFKVRIPTVLPHLFRALQLAAPTALLGAILGEFLGGTQGLGIAMIVAQAELHITLMWGLIVVSSVIAAFAYVVLGLIGRRLTRWSVEAGTSGASASMGTIPMVSDGGLGNASGAISKIRLLASRIGLPVLSVAFVLGVWNLSLKWFGLSSYVAKGPVAVWDYLFVGPMASQNRDPIIGGLWTTLRDAGFGLLAGCVVGCALAFVVVLIPRVETYVLSWGITLRVLPLAAVAPLIGAVFGRGVIAAIIVCAMISFFPTFVLMVGGLNSATPGSIALVHSYGGGRWKTMWKVRIPSSLSALFAALKIAAPGALTGALVTEWTVTGNGLGAQVIVASNESQFGLIWSAIVIVAVASILLYSLAGIGERLAAARGY